MLRLIPPPAGVARATTRRRVYFVSSNRSLATASGSPPKKSKVATRLFSAILGTTALTTATLVYAKNNQDVRDILKDYVPWTDDAIAVVYGERKSWITPISNFLFDSSEQKHKSEVSKSVVETSILDKPIIIEKAKIEKLPYKSSPEILEKPKHKMPVDSLPSVEKEKDIPVLVQKVIYEDVAAIDAAGKAAIGAYKRATEALKVYARKIDTIMENCSDEINLYNLDELKKSSMINEEAEMNIKKAERKLDETLGGGAGPVAERMREEVKKAKTAYDKASFEASVTHRYWSQIEQARRYFTEELQAIFPNADIGAHKLELKGGNPDTLLILALRRILLYQQMLARQDALLRKYIDKTGTGTDEDLIREKVEIALDKERRQLALLYQKKDIIAHSKAQKELQAEINKQLDIHSAHLQDAIDARAKEVADIERQAAEERAEVQRRNHELKLAAVLGRLQGIDEALKARSDADKMARQSQKLWAACEALESALKRDTFQPIPLSKELDAIASVAAESDELVTTVLHSIPSTIKERGIYSELALRERFNKLENACRKLALVPEEGGSLPVYFLSWLQSVFLIKSVGIPRAELGDEVTDFSKLDTFDILQRIRYWVERCNWAQALRYTQLLNGAPSAVARDWAKEVALHLEARQAAKVLLSHASATGLLHL